MKVIPYTIIIIHDKRLKKKVCLSSNYRHQKLALDLLQSWHLECILGTGCWSEPQLSSVQLVEILQRSLPYSKGAFKYYVSAFGEVGGPIKNADTADAG